MILIRVLENSILGYTNRSVLPLQPSKISKNKPEIGSLKSEKFRASLLIGDMKGMSTTLKIAIQFKQHAILSALLQAALKANLSKNNLVI